MRRTIMRYANVSLLMVLRMISPAVKKRFPTDDHLEEAGFLQQGEKKIIEELEKKTKHPKYWIPLVWAAGIITRARREGFVRDDFAVKTLIDELNKFRSGCGGLLNYDWISVPLVYTQVATLVVFAFFLGSLMADQYLDPKKGYPQYHGDLYVPVFSLLQFFFYMGWLMVAEVLVNPFGEDDDDFEVNWLIDRNLQISYVIVDEMHQEHPELLKDQYWEEIFPQNLPYTAATKQFRTTSHMGSTQDVQVPSADFVHQNIMNQGSSDNKRYERNSSQMKESLENEETQPVSIIKHLSSTFSLTRSYLSSLSLINNHSRKSGREAIHIESSEISRRDDDQQSELSTVVSAWKGSKDEDVFRMSDLFKDLPSNTQASSRSCSLLMDSQDFASDRQGMKHNESFPSFPSPKLDITCLDFAKVKVPRKDSKSSVGQIVVCTNDVFPSTSSIKEEKELSNNKQEPEPSVISVFYL